MVESVAVRAPKELEELDASFHPIKPAYVLVYRAQCEKHTEAKHLSSIKAELGERSNRLIFGAEEEFVRAVTTLVDSRGNEHLQDIEVPRCAVFAQLPSVETAKMAFIQNRTMFRHFGPVLWTEPGVHLLFEQPLFKIQCGGGGLDERLAGSRDVQDPPRLMMKSMGKLGNSSRIESPQSLLHCLPEDCLNVQAYLDQRKKIDTESHRGRAQRGKRQDASIIFSKCAEFDSGSDNEEYGPVVNDAGDRFSEKFKVLPHKLDGPDSPRDGHLPLDKMQTGNGIHRSFPRDISFPVSDRSSRAQSSSASKKLMSAPVQSDAWRKFTLVVDPNETVGELKKRIHSNRGYDPQMQRLVYNGEVLRDGMRIRECKIQEGATLILWLVLANGKIKQVPLG